MQKTFSNLRLNVGNNVQDTSSETATLIGRFINTAYNDVLRRFNWDVYSYDYEVSLVAGTQDYILPRDFGEETYVLDATNNSEITFKSLQQTIQDHASSYSQNGTVSNYDIIEKRFNNQPSSASVITAVSDSGDDTTQKIVIRGISGNVEKVESIELTGTSAIAGSTLFSRIISISKSASTIGTVTLTSNSGAVTNAEISPEEIDYKRKFIRVFQKPASAATLQITYKINPLPLSDDNDIPLVDADLLEAGGTMYAWRYKRQMAKAQEWERTFEKEITQAIWRQENSDNRVQQFSVEPASRDIY